MKTILAKFRKNEDGATAIEYALIAGLIGVVIITGATALGNNVNDKFQAVADKIGTGTGTAAAK